MTSEQTKKPQLPKLGVTGTLRFIWTQLTSMRTALLLLLLLAVAAVPGSIFPQRPAGPEVVEQWIEDNPGIGPVLDSLQFFDVYSSVWFSAIYLLLFISLVGCLIPRAKQHWKQLRSQPPRTPRRLSRLPEYGRLLLREQGPNPTEAIDQATAILSKRGYRVDVRDESAGKGHTKTRAASVGAERGYLREIGNLIFHFGLLGVLIFIAVGGMFSYNGQKVLVEGEGFTNNLVAYDSFTPGTAFDEEMLSPFYVELDDFEIEYDRTSTSHYGQPLTYTATMTVQSSPEAEPYHDTLKVNDPLTVDGVRMFLVGNGYAPTIVVRDGEGNVAFDGPVIAQIQEPGTNTSLAVIKAPDAQPDQLGFVGLFLPTSYTGEDGVAVSVDPDAGNPELILNSYYGDLGLDSGEPQNVYVLNTENMTELNSRTNDNGGITLGLGETYELPDGKGSITFESLDRYVGLDIHYDPAKWGVGISAVLALGALAVSLFVRRRRVWVRATEDPITGSTAIEYGLLARGESFGLREENIKIRLAMEEIWPVIPPEESGPVPEESARGAKRSGPSS
ncbi:MULTISPECIES: cytochrome c biogenesis protein ResB [Auritidibacter]|uniref:Cytochrome c biogenesis protein ResB n=1 Tax=Auritidibacter ignavus TaxID=678932 RepID=A0AAJ6AIV7_9MICC|nr:MULTISPECIES: cytochrome c biogenesis protein ResB [Auritidibacter]AXR74913.1 cytochrome c biogenesis protein ResB [Auritidibacter sp. NML130574]PXA78246.1 cytochrome c biogenesis protein ResB [Auritidibacter sp. NML100628]PXA81011.1 cytochrome c biogenesis protein ResB [Auritidibacter sp. NML120636]WGH81466.1 cytochrome c biogenesis protein ResB [Auritidibacter ignavus]WGH83723.1 cytochrome c biogenesis protein ResB [Auritidibacter ignavus]